MNAVSAKIHLDALKNIFHKESAALQQLQKDKFEKEVIIKTLIQEREQVELKKVLVVEAAKEARNQAKDVLEDMGSNALRFIMGDHMSLEIELKEQARQWVANFITKSEESDTYEVETDPAEEEGGGVADVVAISTQTSMLQLIGDYNVAPLLMDEPSKFVSKGHSEQVAKFLSEISSSFLRQVIMVTHDEYLANIGDIAYLFKKVDGKTITKKIA
jgi:ABC-type dipeptide/oligopeptide/nickel transport system ATPase component